MEKVSKTCLQNTTFNWSFVCVCFKMFKVLVYFCLLTLFHKVGKNLGLMSKAHPIGKVDLVTHLVILPSISRLVNFRGYCPARENFPPGWENWAVKTLPTLLFQPVDSSILNFWMSPFLDSGLFVNFSEVCYVFCIDMKFL